MTPYQRDLMQLVGCQIRYAGLTQDGYPYLIVAKLQSGEMFYIIAQCDAEGNGPGFLQITQRQAEGCG